MTTADGRMPRTLAESTDPRDNGAKIRALLVGGVWRQSADLYRTCVSGPSGQRAQTCVGRVEWIDSGPYDFSVWERRENELVGYAARSVGHLDVRGGQEWTLWSFNDHDGYALVGWSSSLALGVDVLINGELAATRNHDFRRLSGGTFRPYRPQEAARG